MNTPKALSKLTKEVSAYCFTGTDQVILYAGYADGLILMREITKMSEEKKGQHPIKPLIGHLNKINQMVFVKDTLFSASQDCTLREWNVKDEICTRIFKF